MYRTICPSRTEGLVTYPETPTGTSAVSVTHQCAANAEVSGGGLMMVLEPSCSCVAGHRMRLMGVVLKIYLAV